MWSSYRLLMYFQHPLAYNLDISFSLLLQVVCAKCSPNNLPLFQFGISKHVRVCTNCYISQLGQISLTITGVSGQPLQVL